MSGILMGEMEFLKADIGHARETSTAEDYRQFLVELIDFCRRELDAATPAGGIAGRWAGEPNSSPRGPVLAGIEDAE